MLYGFGGWKKSMLQDEENRLVLVSSRGLLVGDSLLKEIFMQLAREKVLQHLLSACLFNFH